MSEMWMPIAGHEGYEVSSFGRVRSLNRMLSDGRRYPGKVLTPVMADSGYLRVKLGGGHNGIGIHRLMAEAFLGPCPEGKEVCHNDGIKTRNRLSNLRYGTPSDNAQDRIKHGRQVDKRGELHHNAKLTSKQVRRIRASSAPLAVLATRYSMSKQQISKIRLGQRWGHL